MARYITLLFFLASFPALGASTSVECRKLVGFVKQLEGWAAHNASWASSAAWHEALGTSGLLTAGQLSEIQPALGNLFKVKQAESTRANKIKTDKILKKFLAYSKCGIKPKEDPNAKGGGRTAEPPVFYYKWGDDTCSSVTGYLKERLIQASVSTDPKPCGPGKEKLDPLAGLTWVYETRDACFCKLKEVEKLRAENEK